MLFVVLTHIDSHRKLRLKVRIASFTGHKLFDWKFTSVGKLLPISGLFICKSDCIRFETTFKSNYIPDLIWKKTSLEVYWGILYISSVLLQPYSPPVRFHNFRYHPKSHCSGGMASWKQYRTGERGRTRWVAGPQYNRSCLILGLSVGEYIPICGGK